MTNTVIDNKTLASQYLKEAAAQPYETRNTWLNDKANELGKTPAQVRGILVQAKVYVPKIAAKNLAKGATMTNPDKPSKLGMNKSAYRKAFETALSLPTDSLQSMDKMTGSELAILWDSFVKLSEQANVRNKK